MTDILALLRAELSAINNALRIRTEDVARLTERKKHVETEIERIEAKT